MSIPVDVSKLAEAPERHRFAYLLTASEHGAPYAVSVTPVLRAGELLVDESGRPAAPGACGADGVEIA